jgi:hypothetical protein
MSASGGGEVGTGRRSGEAQYETKVVQAIRGTESRTEAKWRKEGWELVAQDRGTLRTEMTFSRVRPKTLADLLTTGPAAFKELSPGTQRAVLAGAGLVLLMGTLGIVAALSGDEPSEVASPTSSSTAATDPTTPSTAETAAPTQESAAPSAEAAPTAEEPSESAEESTPEVEEPEPYAYAGPDYETIAVDEDVVGGELDQHWVLVDSLDPSDADFEDHVKLIIADVAHEEGTADLSVSVVTDPEIASAESDVRGPDWMAQYGVDYYEDVVVPKNKSGYLALYTGGFDPNTLNLSSSDAAYEVLWLPASDSPDIENWKPTSEAS